MNGPKECRNGLSGAQLPSTAPSKVSEHIFLQRPLSRRANGPGLIILIPRQVDTNGHNKTLDPPPLQKWAEEGYAVALVASEDSVIKDNILLACDSLMRLQECSPKGDFGVISYLASHNVRTAIRTIDTIVAGVFYEDCEYEDISKPLLCHIAGPIPEEGKTQQKDKKNFYYPSARPLFTIPAHPDFSNAQASVSHTRTLAFLKPLMRGPYFDLEAIWEEHTMLEFMTRSPEKTMTTMVQEPYVNHIPTMTGGIGRERLTNFYRFHFIFNNPDDTAMELVSRTVGIDRVVDEFIFSFTHDKFIDWILPGVPPTHQKVKIAMTAVVNVRGDRLYHEHIAWDQASVLRQLGLLPEYLLFPYPIEGMSKAEGEEFEYRVPTSGAETARKLIDERSIESNEMFDFEVRKTQC